MKISYNVLSSKLIIDFRGLCCFIDNLISHAIENTFTVLLLISLSLRFDVNFTKPFCFESNKRALVQLWVFLESETAKKYFYCANYYKFKVIHVKFLPQPRQIHFEVSVHNRKSQKQASKYKSSTYLRSKMWIEKLEKAIALRESVIAFRDDFKGVNCKLDEINTKFDKMEHDLEPSPLLETRKCNPIIGIPGTRISALETPSKDLTETNSLIRKLRVASLLESGNL